MCPDTPVFKKLLMLSIYLKLTYLKGIAAAQTWAHLKVLIYILV